jgi:hypothetical protein
LLPSSYAAPVNANAFARTALLASTSINGFAPVTQIRQPKGASLSGISSFASQLNQPGQSIGSSLSDSPFPRQTRQTALMAKKKGIEEQFFSFFQIEREFLVFARFISRLSWMYVLDIGIWISELKPRGGGNQPNHRKTNSRIQYSKERTDEQ